MEPGEAWLAARGQTWDHVSAVPTLTATPWERMWQAHRWWP